MKKINEELQTQLAKLCIEGEYDVGKRNQQFNEEDFESYLALMDSIRSEKDYDWMSDIRIPEFSSHVLTQASLDVSNYFRTRDFVECYVMDNSDQAIKAADAAKECINRTLQQRHLHYYQKRVRAGMINQLNGEVFAECLWEQELETKTVGTRQIPNELDVDIYDQPIQDRSVQVPKVELIDEDVTADIAKIDRFYFEIIDPRNVVTDHRFTYDLQQKDFVYIRSEKTIQDLEAESEKAGYFNLDKLKDEAPDNTETSEETYNKEQQKRPFDSSITQRFDVLKRYGKFWVVVKTTDEYGLPEEIECGVKVDGTVKNNAELHEVVMIWAIPKGKKPVQIAFHPQPYIDVTGKPYRPVIRGKCYLHPTEDNGFGDAKYAHDLQIAIDDTFNLSQDRTKLATIPMFQIKKFSFQDNDSLYVEPGHFLQVNEPGDISEFKIQDNIAGSLNQIQVLTQKMQQIDAIFPTTMGQLPAQASTTATAIAGAEQKSDVRTNFKALTFENTFDCELYWMILQMTNQFAKPETGINLMGDKVYNFDISREYWFKPLSQSTESEQSKAMKVRNYIQYLQALGPYMQFFMNQPNFVQFLNLIFTRISEYMGDEVSNVSKKLLDPSIPPAMQGGGAMGGMGGGGMPQAPTAGLPPASNQNMQQQSATEQFARAGAGRGYY